MLLNRGIREDSWESLGLQEDPTSVSLKEISPGCSLEGVMLKLKLQYFGYFMWRVDSCLLLDRQILYHWAPWEVWTVPSVQSLSRVRLFATPWIAACQASLSITNSWSSLRLMSIESVMPSSHLILCRPLLLLPPIPPSIRVFSNKSTLHMRWPKYWS